MTDLFLIKSEDREYIYKSCPNEYNELRSLWRAVILQALYDMRLKPKNRKNRSAKNKAITWVKLDNQHFLDVCAIAEFNPIKVYKAAYDDAPLKVSGVKFM